MVNEFVLDDSKLLCASCVGKRKLRAWVLANGTEGRCEYNPAHKSKKVVTLQEFGDQADEYLRSNYQLGELRPYYSDNDKRYEEREGDSMMEILLNDLQCEETLCEDLEEYLPHTDASDIMDGGEGFYDFSDLYEKISVAQKRELLEQEEYWYEERYRFKWDNFCILAKHQKRYFGLKEELDQLFGDVKTYEAGVIKPIYDLEKGVSLYRSRLLDDDFKEANLRKNPLKELSCPTPNKTKPGRMNVEFIPALYASFNPETALAEMRPGIADQIAIGHFRLKTSVRIFDFTVFERALRNKQLTDVERQKCLTHSRYQFIRDLQDEISKPISMNARSLEYIPTQILAEYVQHYLNCDGMIYKSAMNRDLKADNRNIVLFGKYDIIINNLLEYMSYEIASVSNIKFEYQSIKDTDLF